MSVYTSIPLSSYRKTTSRPSKMIVLFDSKYNNAEQSRVHMSVTALHQVNAPVHRATGEITLAIA
eukprot:21336-Heterococcus_DN1.PRE.2